MRSRFLWMVVVGMAIPTAFSTWSLLWGQDTGTGSTRRTRPARPARPAESSEIGQADAGSSPIPLVKDGDSKQAGADAGNSPLRQQALVAAQHGGDWLARMNGLDGKFLPGCNPALNQDFEGVHFLHQAGAAWALARAARLAQEKKFAARATQAIALLLSETTVDSTESKRRYSSLPAALVNRLGSAGLVVSAIQELPLPQQDMLDQSEELCRYIQSCQRADGSLVCLDAPTDEKATAEQNPADIVHAGMALYGVALSQHRQSAQWKSELIHKAGAYYRAAWKKQKTIQSTAWLALAFGEAYRTSKETAFAEAVFDMADWVAALQYDRLDPRHPQWWGGFLGWENGQSIIRTPDMTTALAGQILIEGCRLARACGDSKRVENYTSAVNLALPFVFRMQYTPINCRHFEEWYRPKLLGAFHASPEDGDVRLEYTQHAVSMLCQYVLTVPKAK